eukprot:scaffold3330_cov164-Amphora_coffeaeformis.AAC.12
MGHPNQRSQRTSRRRERRSVLTQFLSTHKLALRIPMKTHILGNKSSRCRRPTSGLGSIDSFIKFVLIYRGWDVFPTIVHRLKNSKGCKMSSFTYLECIDDWCLKDYVRRDESSATGGTSGILEAVSAAKRRKLAKL